MSTGSTTRGKTIVCLLLWLLCQSRENKCVYSSYDSLSFLPASPLMPCLPWVQRTVRYRETVSTSFLSVTPSTLPFKPEEAPPTQWRGYSHPVLVPSSWEGCHPTCLSMTLTPATTFSFFLLHLKSITLNRVPAS